MKRLAIALMLFSACAKHATPSSEPSAASVSAPQVTQLHIVPLPTTGMTALRFGALADGTGRFTRNVIIYIRGEDIAGIDSGDFNPPVPTTDLRAYTAIPGLIDVHTHMTYWRDKAVPNGSNAPRGKDSVVVYSAKNALRTLEAGVTTVRDLGAANYADIALRDSINKGVWPGPRMFVAGYGFSKARAGRGGQPPQRNPANGRIVDTADIAAAVQAQKDAGADWIKVFGSTGTYANVTGDQTFTDREMQIAAAEARKAGLPIAIHSYGVAGGRAALRAGVNSVEHPAGLDMATLQEWAKTNTYYVPTVDHNRFYAENAPLLGYTKEQVAGLDSFRNLNLETVRRAHEAGVKMAMGSDAVYWMFGENTHELEWFVKAGMTPAQALAVGTINGAELLGKSSKLGKIATGYYADIVAVKGNPLQNIRVAIDSVKWVMKGGKVVVDRRR